MKLVLEIKMNHLMLLINIHPVNLMVYVKKDMKAYYVMNVQLIMERLLQLLVTNANQIIILV